MVFVIFTNKTFYLLYVPSGENFITLKNQYYISLFISINIK